MPAARIEAGGSTTEPEEPPKAGRRPPVARELAILTAVFLPLAALLAARLADRHRLIGFWSDSEALLWQAHQVGEILREGTTVLSNKLFGTPTPYGYAPVSFFQIAPIALVKALTKDVWFSFNLVVFLFLFLNFASMYGVLRYLGFDRALSFLMGTVYLFAPASMMRAFSHLVLVGIFPIPLFLYLAYRAKVQPERLRPWILLGLLNGLAFWINEYYGLFLLLAWGLFLIAHARQRGRAILRPLAAWAIPAAVVVAPVAFVYWERASFDRAHGLESVRPVQEGYLYSASPASYVFPSVENPIHARLPTLYPNAYSEGFNYLGALNLGALALWLWRRRGRRGPPPRAPAFLRTMRGELTVVAVLGLTLSLGPLLKLNEAFLKLPVWPLVRWEIPLFSQIRAWGRFGVFVYAVVTIAAAFIVRDHVVNRLRSRRSRGVALGLLLLVVPLDQFPFARIHTHDMPVSEAVEIIRRTPGRFFVLHVPYIGPGNALFNVTAELFQTFHGKPIVNGYSAFPNPLLDRKVLDTPVQCVHYPGIRDLPRHGECAPDSIGAHLEAAGIGIIVYEKKTRYFIPGHYAPSDDRVTRERLRALLRELERDGRFVPVFEDAEVRVYRDPDLAAG